MAPVQDWWCAQLVSIIDPSLVTGSSSESAAPSALGVERESLARLLRSTTNEQATVPANAAERASYAQQWSLNGCTGFSALYDMGLGAAALLMPETYTDADAATWAAYMEKLVFNTGGGMMKLTAAVMESFSQFLTLSYTGRGWVVPGAQCSGFTRTYPFFDFEQVQATPNLMDMPYVTAVNLANDPTKTPLWTAPYQDMLSLKWMLSRIVPVYGANETQLDGVCAIDIIFAAIVTYLEELSETLPWGAYVVMAGSDGTIIGVPMRGSKDWSGDASFNFSHAASQADFNTTVWNLFTNPEFSELGIPVYASLQRQAAGIDPPGKVYTKQVDFGSGKRIVSWNFVADTYWVVLAVVDAEEALKSQRAGFASIIAVSVILAVVVSVTTLSAAVYAAVRRQYARLSNKIADLNTKLEDAQRELENMNEHSNDAAALNALSSGVTKITSTLNDIMANPTRPLDQAELEALRLATTLLLRRDFDVIKPEIQLTENQQQFIQDCGMNVRLNSLQRIKGDGELDVSHTSHHSGADSLAQQVKVQRVEVNDWGFDAFGTKSALNGEAILPAVLFSVMTEQQLLACPEFPPLDISALLEFAKTLDTNYCGGPQGFNPYHNSMHASDVTQAFHVMLTLAMQCCPEFAVLITPMDRLACFLACAMHDYRHVGRNNNFLKATLHRLHVHFVDSVLERMHAATSFELLFFTEECKALRNFTPAQQLEVHSIATQLILGTDMAHHVELLDKFKSWVANKTIFTGDDKFTGKMLALQLIVKAADLSNAFREWPVCRQWTNALVEEFLSQGAAELQMGLSTSKFMDGSTKTEDMQETYIPLIVLPLLQALARVFPEFSQLEEHAWHNLVRVCV
eukprot:TRINITY_DN2669_c0_g1_i1.p1 TRINITY_DN2669_c0_g1~~TRINITY_DN2669_c0_g1_i1.p1  ORF type:complete len:979 (-),score=295.67 TRINITY_DN2669_c0_g1_i1:212-2782(-)